MINPDPMENTVFMHLPEGEKISALHGMIAYLRAEQANDKAHIIELQNKAIQNEADIEYLRGELTGIGMRKTSDMKTTSQKIQAVMDQRFAFWKPILQHVIGVFLDIVILAILLLAFGAKIP